MRLEPRCLVFLPIFLALACGSTRNAGIDAAGGEGGEGGASGSGAGDHGRAGEGGRAGVGGLGGAGGRAGGGSVGSALPACPGSADPAPGASCRTNADCPRLYTCGPSNVGPGCGAALPPPHECSGDAGCTADQVCVPSPPGACVFGQGTVCRARCTGTSCASDEMCEMTSGRCLPALCGTAFACPAGLTCDPSRAGADAHGCAIASCSTDGYACPTGYACAAGSDTNANGCSSISCVGGGFKCPANYDCDASSTSPHHCKRRACASDGSCDCGACIQGACQDHLFVCSPPPAA